AQPKLASRPKAESTRGRVFLIRSLAAESPREYAHRYGELASGRLYDESDPIGLWGGSYSTYSYVGANPISRVDPQGLQEVLPTPEGPIVVPTLPGSTSNQWNQARDAEALSLQEAISNAIAQVNQLMSGADQALDNIVQMAKGGTQNKSNEYSRAATAQAQASGKDPCDILAEWYREARAAGEAAEAQKIVEAQKALGCRNKRKRCP